MRPEKKEPRSQRLLPIVNIELNATLASCHSSRALPSCCLSQSCLLWGSSLWHGAVACSSLCVSFACGWSCAFLGDWWSCPWFRLLIRLWLGLHLSLYYAC